MGVELPSEPINRKEQYLAKIAGQAVEIPAEPLTREEAYLDEIAKNSGGGGGTTNYEDLNNLPKVNNVELKGNKSLADLGIASASTVSGILDGASIDSFADVETALNGKQDTLTFDDTPTDGSNNPVKSNGIYDALVTKANTDMVAADFNAGSSYTAGNYCVQDGKLYKFKNNHTGAWSSADVDEVKITGELSALKSGLTNLVKRKRIEKTTDSVGDFDFTLENNGILVSVRPLRSTDHYNSWWGATIASTVNNTDYSCKAIKDDGTALASQRVLLDVYYI